MLGPAAKWVLHWAIEMIMLLNWKSSHFWNQRSGLNLLMDNICLKNVYCVHWIAKNNEKDDNA